jgi:hypothetical protein
MSRLDDELKQALEREDPPPGFAARVLAQVESRRNHRRWWTAAIAAALMLAGGLEFERERRIRAQGERAKQQVILALRITSHKLQFIKEKIHAIDSTKP